MPIRRPIIRRRCWRWKPSVVLVSAKSRARPFRSPISSSTPSPPRWNRARLIREVIVPVEDQSHGHQLSEGGAAGFRLRRRRRRRARPQSRAARSPWRASASPDWRGKPYRAIDVEKVLEGRRLARRYPEGRRRGGRWRGSQLRSVRFRRLSQTPGPRLHHARAGGRQLEGGLKISGSYTVPAIRERAYQLLQDPAVLAKCMPGTRPSGQDRPTTSTR